MYSLLFNVVKKVVALAQVPGVVFLFMILVCRTLLAFPLWMPEVVW
jgi:hypothetical protein